MNAKRLSPQAEVAVKDTGIGIALEYLEKVFERFWRADQARHYHHHYHQSSTGLALTVRWEGLGNGLHDRLPQCLNLGLHPVDIQTVAQGMGNQTSSAGKQDFDFHETVLLKGTPCRY